MDKSFYVYLLASKKGGVLYLGVTSNLVKRVYEHRHELVNGFTSRYKVKRLVWYEIHADALAAITREKQIKKWNPSWKIQLIEKENPEWRDLFSEISV